MPAYIVAQLNVHDPEEYSTYTAQTPDIVRAYGGKFLARAGEVVTLDGEEFRGRLVILEFPDMESVKKFHASPEYQKVLPIRHRSSTGSMVVIDGVNDGYAPDPQVVATNI